jgi:hypothetical protein
MFNVLYLILHDITITMCSSKGDFIDCHHQMGIISFTGIKELLPFFFIEIIITFHLNLTLYSPWAHTTLASVHHYVFRYHYSRNELYALSWRKCMIFTYFILSLHNFVLTCGSLNGPTLDIKIKPVNWLITHETSLVVIITFCPLREKFLCFIYIRRCNYNRGVLVDRVPGL